MSHCGTQSGSDLARALISALEETIRQIRQEAYMSPAYSSSAGQSRLEVPVPGQHFLQACIKLSWVQTRLQNKPIRLQWKSTDYLTNLTSAAILKACRRRYRETHPGFF